MKIGTLKRTISLAIKTPLMFLVCHSLWAQDLTPKVPAVMAQQIEDDCAHCLSNETQTSANPKSEASILSYQGLQKNIIFILNKEQDDGLRPSFVAAGDFNERKVARLEMGLHSNSIYSCVFVELEHPNDNFSLFELPSILRNAQHRVGTRFWYSGLSLEISRNIEMSSFSDLVDIDQIRFSAGIDLCEFLASPPNPNKNNTEYENSNAFVSSSLEPNNPNNQIDSSVAKDNIQTWLLRASRINQNLLNNLMTQNQPISQSLVEKMDIDSRSGTIALADLFLRRNNSGNPANGRLAIFPSEVKMKALKILIDRYHFHKDKDQLLFQAAEAALMYVALYYPYANFQNLALSTLLTPHLVFSARETALNLVRTKASRLTFFQHPERQD